MTLLRRAAFLHPVFRFCPGLFVAPAQLRRQPAKTTHRDGTITAVHLSEGQHVERGVPLLDGDRFGRRCGRAFGFFWIDLEEFGPFSYRPRHWSPHISARSPRTCRALVGSVQLKHPSKRSTTEEKAASDRKGYSWPLPQQPIVLSAEDAKQVAGGLNPQPLPPRIERD